MKRITVLLPTKALLRSLFLCLGAFVCTRPSTHCTCETEMSLCWCGRGLAGGGGGDAGGGGGLLLGRAPLLSPSCWSHGRAHVLAVWGWTAPRPPFLFLAAQFPLKSASDGHSQDVVQSFIFVFLFASRSRLDIQGTSAPPPLSVLTSVLLETSREWNNIQITRLCQLAHRRQVQVCKV